MLTRAFGSLAEMCSSGVLVFTALLFVLPPLPDAVLVKVLVSPH